ncbi:MAG: hypothetical protein IKN53_01170, partial [Oscillibacter sp.]|nr:hypothetical protein [Oscillibacter sp.]
VALTLGAECATGETYQGAPVYLRAVPLDKIRHIGLNSTSVDGTGIAELLSVSGFIENKTKTTKITLPFFSMQTNGTVLSDVRISAQLFTTGGNRVLRFNVVLAADNNATVVGAVDMPTAVIRYTREATA